MNPTRNGLLAKIHIAKKDLAMLDDDYRGLLEHKFGVSSSKDLSIKQLAELLNHFVSAGWTGPESSRASRANQKTSRKSDFVVIPDSAPFAAQKRYALGLAKALGWKPAGLDARCKKQFGVEKFLWIDNQGHMQTLLKDMLNRCKRRGIDSNPA